MAEVQKDDQRGNREDSVLFILLVQMFAQQSLMQMGKIMNPITQKAERDLEGAQMSIGMLKMLEGKTSGNLNKEETHLLKNVLTDLQLNFVEEMQRDQAGKTSSPTTMPPPSSEKSTETPSSPAADEPKVKFHKKYE